MPRTPKTPKSDQERIIDLESRVLELEKVVKDLRENTGEKILRDLAYIAEGLGIDLGEDAPSLQIANLDGPRVPERGDRIEVLGDLGLPPLEIRKRKGA